MRHLAAALVLGGSLAAFGPAFGDTIALHNGWNLVAFPVQPADPSVGAVLAPLISQSAFNSLWTYDGATGQWSAYVAGNPVPGLNSITQIQPGRGYWINVVGNPTLTVTPANPPVPVPTLSGLARGWNLIATSAHESKRFDRVLNGLPVLQIWEFDAIGGVFKGIVLSQAGVFTPTRQDFSDMLPDQGYWVLIDQSQSGTVPFGPDLGTSMPGDTDVMPLLPPASGPGQRVPWTTVTAGDEDIGQDGFYDSPVTQRAVTFHDVSEVQNIAIYNNASGVLSYVATVDHQSPLCGSVPHASLPWLSFQSTDAVTGALTTVSTIADSVASETATIALVANRIELTPGLYCAVVNIATNSVSQGGDATLRSVKVFIEIPKLEGDYEIQSNIDTINGNAADTHSPKFFMSLYSDSGGVKAILDDRQTLLLPQRVRLVGDVYQTGTNRFLVSGSFALPTGNPANPFNTTLRRDITFVARRRERADDTGAGLGPLDLIGDYAETIRGPLGDANPVFLAGTFTGRRVSSTPSVLDETTGSSLVIQAIPDGGTVEYQFNLTDPRLITQVISTLTVTHTNPTDLWIRLVPPPALGLGELTLRRASNNVLGAISFEETQTSVADLSVLAGLLSTGTWKLRIQDEVINGKIGQVNAAGIRIRGTRVVSVSGTVSGVGQGAIVSLTGCGVVVSTTTNASGAYSFSNLVDCAYRLSVQAAGFDRVGADVIIGPTDPSVVVNLAPGPGAPVPSTNVPYPCEVNGSNQCVGLRFTALTTAAAAGALLPNARLAYVNDAGTFDLDRPPVGVIGPEDTVLFSSALNPVTLTNACVTPSNPQVQGSSCIEPGDNHVDPAIGANSMRLFLAIGGPVIGTSVGGTMQISIGANP